VAAGFQPADSLRTPASWKLAATRFSRVVAWRKDDVWMNRGASLIGVMKALPPNIGRDGAGRETMTTIDVVSGRML
jgi:hypothetical protein